MFGDMSIIGFYMASPTMIVLAVCSIVTVGFVVERLLYFKTTAHDTKGFMKALANPLKNGDVHGALDYCQRSKSPIGRIMCGITCMSPTAPA